MPRHSRQSDRRQFLKSTALTGVGVWFAGQSVAQESKSPNERIRFACVGIGGKGSSDSGDAGKSGDVVAICDIDDGRLDGAAKRFPKAKRYNDYRKMLDEMAGSVDAVTVSTPDHSHAPAAAMAMKAGKHCFVQKPLSHSIYEARRLGEIAKEMNVATQMGNQGTAGSGLREAAAVVRAGAIGTVSEVHVWTNRPVWPQGGDRPAEEPVPEGLHWDLFIGPAPSRPYGKGYHPFSWRGWWDFGTGALGDMACHTMNMPYMALDLRDPVAVEAESSGHNKDSYPKWSQIRYDFPARGDRAAVTMHWYDGGKTPADDLLEGEKKARSGALIVGDKGKVYSPGDYGGSYKLLGGVSKPEVEFAKSPGHFQEWVRAIQGGEPAMSNFPDYAGPLTETLLLGNLAVWAGKKVEWDAKNMKPTNAPELGVLVKREYREGYSL